MGRFLVKVSFFFMIDLKQSWLSAVEKEPPSKSDVSFQVIAENLKFIAVVFWFDVLPCVINT